MNGQRKIGVFLFIIVFWVASASHGDLIIEPYLGYGSASIKLGDGKWVDSRSNGFLLGFRVGFTLSPTFSLAVDYSGGGPYRITDLNDPESFLFFSTTNYGLGLGINLGPAHLWGGYYASVIMDELSRSFIYSGKGTRFGIGIEMSSKMTLNLVIESDLLTPKTMNSSIENEICMSAGCSNLNAAINVMSIVVSAPFN